MLRTLTSVAARPLAAPVAAVASIRAARPLATAAAAPPSSSSSPYDVVVIGGGPGGYVAAIKAGMTTYTLI
jgi:NADPH-dependent 2,4-dienoyl-CoA reductase/sulfur reductase-like enzyme